MGEPALRGEVVVIGTELLLGDSVDSNSAVISARLAEVGVHVARHAVVGDDRAEMVAALREAWGRAEVVVVTGGLGPTSDDLTREAVAEAAGVALERRPELEEALRQYFASRGREMPVSNLQQADRPAGARTLAAVGSAPGFALEVGSSVVYCLPGVPSEMQIMLERDVLPDVVRRGGLATTVSRVVRTAGMAEAAVGEACAEVEARLAASGVASLAYLASRGETRVRVTATAPTRGEALAIVDPVVTELVGRLGPAVVGVDDEGLEAAIGRLLLARRWTLGLAESVTGGGVGARLVTVPGASNWFRGAVVVYATPAKSLLAGLDAALVERHGPVSGPVASDLAVAARARLHADVGLAIVGVAGPDAQGGEPVGTTIVAVALPDAPAPEVRRLTLPAGSRTVLQGYAASAALDFLRRRLAALA